MQEHCDLFDKSVTRPWEAGRVKGEKKLERRKKIRGTPLASGYSYRLAL